MFSMGLFFFFSFRSGLKLRRELMKVVARKYELNRRDAARQQVAASDAFNAFTLKEAQYQAYLLSSTNTMSFLRSVDAEDDGIVTLQEELKELYSKLSVEEKDMYTRKSAPAAVAEGGVPERRPAIPQLCARHVAANITTNQEYIGLIVQLAHASKTRRKFYVDVLKECLSEEQFERLMEKEKEFSLLYFMEHYGLSCPYGNCTTNLSESLNNKSDPIRLSGPYDAVEKFLRMADNDITMRYQDALAQKGEGLVVTRQVTKMVIKSADKMSSHTVEFVSSTDPLQVTLCVSNNVTKSRNNINFDLKPGPRLHFSDTVKCSCDAFRIQGFICGCAAFALKNLHWAVQGKLGAAHLQLAAFNVGSRVFYSDKYSVDTYLTCYSQGGIAHASTDRLKGTQVFLPFFKYTSKRNRQTSSTYKQCLKQRQQSLALASASGTETEETKRRDEMAWNADNLQPSLRKALRRRPKHCALCDDAHHDMRTCDKPDPAFIVNRSKTTGKILKLPTLTDEELRVLQLGPKSLASSAPSHYNPPKGDQFVFEKYDDSEDDDERDEAEDEGAAGDEDEDDDGHDEAEDESPAEGEGDVRDERDVAEDEGAAGDEDEDDDGHDEAEDESPAEGEGEVHDERVLKKARSHGTRASV